MYAIIQTGGKQYRVQPGDVIDVELFASKGRKDSKLEFDRVLMVAGKKGLQVGDPVVAGARVSGRLVGEVRGPKLVVFKKKRRKGYKRRTGHRQDLLRVQIDKITV